MTLRLHWSPDSANLVIRMALEELGLPFEAARVDRARGAQRDPAYLALNPQGLIPVLEDDGIVLFETGAILLHLADRTGRLGPGGPAADDPAARAAFLRWLFWISNTLHADLRAVFYSHRVIEGAEAEALLVAGIARRVAAHVDLIEGAMASGNWPGAERDAGWGEDPGDHAAPLLTDLYLGACLRWAQIYPIGQKPLIGPPRGRVGALLARLDTRPAIRRALAAEAIPEPGFTAPRRPDLPAGEVTG